MERWMDRAPGALANAIRFLPPSEQPGAGVTQWHWDPGGGWMASQNQARCNSQTASAVSRRRTPFPNGKHHFQTADTVSKRVPRNPAFGVHFQTVGAVSKRRAPFPNTVSRFAWNPGENGVHIIF